MSKKMLGIKTARGFIEYRGATVELVDNPNVSINEDLGVKIKDIDIWQLGNITYGKGCKLSFTKVVAIFPESDGRLVTRTEPFLKVSGVKGVDIPVVLGTVALKYPSLLPQLYDDKIYTIDMILQNNQIYLEIIAVEGVTFSNQEYEFENFSLARETTFLIDYYNGSNNGTPKVFN